MNGDAVVAVLNALLAAEQQSIAPRLFESTVFVSDASTGAARLAERLVAQSNSTQSALAERIIDLGGEPRLRSGNSMSADLHYLEVHAVLPRVIADYRRLIETYREAGERIGNDSGGSALVARLTTAHEEELHSLEELAEHTGQHFA